MPVRIQTVAWNKITGLAATTASCPAVYSVCLGTLDIQPAGGYAVVTTVTNEISLKTSFWKSRAVSSAAVDSCCSNQ